MTTITPDNGDPVPLRNSPPRVGIILIRFIALLALAVAALTLIWSS